MARTLLLVVGLLFAATTLAGCVIEPGPYHHGWYGWHHGYDR